MLRIRTTVGFGVLAAVCAVIAAPASAATTTQTVSCSASGLLGPLTPAPKCVTPQLTVPADFYGNWTIAVRGKASTLLGNAAMRLDGYTVGGSVTQGIGACGPTASTCTASFGPQHLHRGGGPAVSLAAGCVWTATGLALVQISDCAFTLTLTPGV
jgi:hypothetical protein